MCKGTSELAPQQSPASVAVPHGAGLTPGLLDAAFTPNLLPAPSNQNPAAGSNLFDDTFGTNPFGAPPMNTVCAFLIFYLYFYFIFFKFLVYSVNAV